MSAKFKVGQSVRMSGVKDAVVVDVLKARGKLLYVVEYTVDDEIERRRPTGRRYTQPRFESELKGI